MSRGIDAFLEGFDAEAPDGVDEMLLFLPFFHIDVDQP
jgi:hypothetical protein